jgi:hypothetical protein
MATNPTPARTGLPPLSRAVKITAAAALGLTVAALVFDRPRPRTGDLLVQSDAPDLRLRIDRDGRTVVAATDRRSFRLPAGVYDVIPEMTAADPALVPRRVSVAAGGRAVVRIGPPGWARHEESPRPMPPRRP